jgi:hypothetical protein
MDVNISNPCGRLENPINIVNLSKVLACPPNKSQWQ